MKVGIIVSKPKIPRPPSAGEEALAFHLRSYCVAHEREYRFDAERMWRFDFAIPELKIGIEVEGGIHSGGRHTRASGYTKDMEKYNAASQQGWTVLRYTTRQAKNGEAIQAILVHLMKVKQ